MSIVRVISVARIGLVPRPPSDSKAKLITATAKLLQTTGYHATSIKDIARVANAPIGSLYFLFPGGKDELVIAALEQSGREVADILAVLLADPITPQAVVATYFGAIQWLLTESAYTEGCPIATVALEAAPANEAIADTIAAAFEAWTSTLRSALERAGLPDQHLAVVATTTLAAVEGALILARASRQPDAFTHVAAGITTLVEHLALPQPTNRTTRSTRR
jgi:TetR/AcrR family transcriptional regulator, lmrAB and yxaGH operons repressor